MPNPSQDMLNTYWKLIDESFEQSGGDREIQSKFIEQYLRNQDKEYLVTFDRAHYCLKNSFYSPAFISASGLAYVEDNGFGGWFGSDGWSDFLECIVSLPKKYVTAMLAHPQIIAEIPAALYYQEITLGGWGWKLIEEKFGFDFQEEHYQQMLAEYGPHMDVDNVFYNGVSGPMIYVEHGAELTPRLWRNRKEQS